MEVESFYKEKEKMFFDNTRRPWNVMGRKDAQIVLYLDLCFDEDSLLCFSQKVSY